MLTEKEKLNLMKAIGTLLGRRLPLLHSAARSLGGPPHKRKAVIKAGPTEGAAPVKLPKKNPQHFQ